MPDTVALKIINISIDSIQVEVAECKTNIEQEIHIVTKACTNTEAGVKTKQDADGQNDQSYTNKSIIFFIIQHR